jgi:hypothetical protein
MSDLEARLDQALKADVPQARDPMFRVQVMERRAQAALRRRLLAGIVLTLVVAILGALGMAVAETLPGGTERLAAIAGIGAALTALLAAPYLGGRTALRGLAQRAAWGLGAVARVRLWR